jgi:hypothetical protein
MTESVRDGDHANRTGSCSGYSIAACVTPYDASHSPKSSNADVVVPNVRESAVKPTYLER